MLTAAKRVDELARTFQEAGEVKTYREGLAMVKLKEPSLWGDYLKESGVRAYTGKGENPAQEVDRLAKAYVEAGASQNYKYALALVSLEHPTLWQSYVKGGEVRV